jgi:hypothetical protein
MHVKVSGVTLGNTLPDEAHLCGGVDLMQDQPGVIRAQLLFNCIFQLEARDDALPLPPHGGLEAAGGRPRPEPGDGDDK